MTSDYIIVNIPPAHEADFVFVKSQGSFELLLAVHLSQPSPPSTLGFSDAYFLIRLLVNLSCSHARGSMKVMYPSLIFSVVNN